MLHAPTDSKERKALPVCTGVLDYFPDALLAVADLSRKGNDKHNPGLPLQWSKHLSNDHADCILRHLIDRGTIDPEDNVRHSTKVAWRALALLQIEIEEERKGEVVKVERLEKMPAPKLEPRAGDAVDAALLLLYYQGEVERIRRLLNTVEPPNCSICGRPECGSVEPACVAGVWPAS